MRRPDDRAASQRRHRRELDRLEAIRGGHQVAVDGQHRAQVDACRCAEGVPDVLRDEFLRIAREGSRARHFEQQRLQLRAGEAGGQAVEQGCTNGVDDPSARGHAADGSAARPTVVTCTPNGGSGFIYSCLDRVDLSTDGARTAVARIEVAPIACAGLRCGTALRELPPRSAMEQTCFGLPPGSSSHSPFASPQAGNSRETWYIPFGKSGDLQRARLPRRVLLVHGSRRLSRESRGGRRSGAGRSRLLHDAAGHRPTDRARNLASLVARWPGETGMAPATEAVRAGKLHGLREPSRSWMELAVPA